MVEVGARLPEVVLYTRAGCHLCDEARQELDRLRKHTPFDLRAVNIDQDPELQHIYNDEVPVIFIGGRKAFKYRIDPREFLKKLQKAQSESTPQRKS